MPFFVYHNLTFTLLLVFGSHLNIKLFASNYYVMYRRAKAYSIFRVWDPSLREPMKSYLQLEKIKYQNYVNLGKAFQAMIAWHVKLG